MIYGNTFLPEEYLVEYTGANKQYLKLFKELKEDVNIEKMKYKKAINKKDKEAALASLKEIERLCDESKKIDFKIQPDEQDAILAGAVVLIKAFIAGAAITVLAAPLTTIATNLISIGTGVYEGMKISPRVDNPLTITKDKTKRLNVFRNLWANFFKKYKDWIAQERNKLKLTDW